MTNWTALEINDTPVALADVLARAKWRGQLGFLQEIVDLELIRQAAGQMGITVTDEELQAAADDFRLSHDLEEAAELEAWLKSRSLTAAEWEEVLEADALAGKVRTQVTAGKVEPYFAQRRLQFDRITLSQIIVENEDLAQELHAEIVEEDQDFHAAAREHSQDERTRAASGYLGRVSRDDLEPNAQAVVFGAQNGDVVGPVKTAAGWMLYRIERVHRAALDESTRLEIETAIFEEFLSELRDKSNLRAPLLELVKDDEGEEDEDDTDEEATDD